MLICLALFVASFLPSAQASAATPATALFLDGRDDYVSLADANAFNFDLAPGESITIEAFIRSTAQQIKHERQAVVRKPGAFSLELDFSHAVPALRFNVGDRSDLGSDTRFSRDLFPGFRHVAAVITRTSSNLMTSLFMDGFGYTAEAVSGNMTSLSSLCIGGSPGGNNFQGWIDEVRISRTARYSGDAYVVPNTAFANDPSTLGLWHFDELPLKDQFSDASGVNAV